MPTATGIGPQGPPRRPHRTLFHANEPQITVQRGASRQRRPIHILKAPLVIPFMNVRMVKRIRMRMGMAEIM